MPFRLVSASCRAKIASFAFTPASIADGATGADGEIPEHVREIFDFVSARNRAELEWTRELARRLRDGKYRFTGEAGFPELGAGQGGVTGMG